MFRIGIDLGGTKIEAIVLDERGQTLFRDRVATPQQDYSAVLQTIVSLIGQSAADVLSKHGIRLDLNNPAATKIGLATPGAMSRKTGLMKNANSTCLNDQALDKDLARLLGRPVKLANDANCFVVSEAHDGAAAGASIVFGVILGTGVGGGFVINGQLVEGANAIAGEWGHNPLPQFGVQSSASGYSTNDDNRAKCYCGQTGCIETWLSGPGFARAAALPSNESQQGSAFIDSHEIIRRMRSGDEEASKAFADYVDRLSRALVSVINIIDPDVIVLGGGLSQVKEIYQQVPLRWTRYIFSDEIRTRLVQNMHGDSSGVRGAAWL